MPVIKSHWRVFHAATWQQSERWYRRLKNAGYEARRVRVPIGDHVWIARDGYSDGRYYADVWTDAEKIPPGAKR